MKKNIKESHNKYRYTQISNTGGEQNYTTSEIRDNADNTYDYNLEMSRIMEFEEIISKNKKPISDKFREKLFNDYKRRFINEDTGAGVASTGNTTGMGAVITPQASAIPGQTAIGTPTAGTSFGEGGIVGSGDIGAGQIKRPITSRRKKRALSKMKDMIKNIKSDKTTSKSDIPKATSLLKFNEFTAK